MAAYRSLPHQRTHRPSVSALDHLSRTDRTPTTDPLIPQALAGYRPLPCRTDVAIARPNVGHRPAHGFPDGRRASPIPPSRAHHQEQTPPHDHVAIHLFHEPPAGYTPMGFFGQNAKSIGA